MQTFLPYNHVRNIAQCLDYRRLGKQRVEAKQTLECLLGITYPIWANSPVVKMWRGYELGLCLYGMAMCEEWIHQEYKDNLLPFFEDQYHTLLETKSMSVPWWWDNEKLITSHRSQLLNKNYEYYSQFEWSVKEIGLPYLWPVIIESNQLFWFSVDGKHKQYIQAWEN